MKKNDEVIQIVRKVTLRFITDVMFDRYPGDNETKLTPEQMLYYAKDGKTLVLPSVNVMSFLSAQNTTSAPKRLLDSRKYKAICQAMLSFVHISPQLIPFVRDGKSVVFGGFDGDVDPSSGAYIHRSTARLKDGIPNPKTRPALPIPLSLSFDLTMFKNKEINETQVYNLLVDGGIALGLGTFRGVFGKFAVEGWERIGER